jgi:transglutaminase-like putative cysteine protease
MRIRINHVTHYRFSHPAWTLIQILRMTPQNHDSQTVVDWRIGLDRDARLIRHADAYGNIVHRLFIERPTGEISIDVSGEVETRPSSGVLSGIDEPLPPGVFLRTTDLSKADAAITTFARDIAAGLGRDRLELAHALNTALFRQISFDVDASHVATTAAEAFAAGSGVCQDLAQILIAAARTLGMPARYVSGQLCRRDGRVEQEAGHAWAELYIDGLGWAAFDPAHGISADDAYVRVAIGLDYREAAPVSGVRFGGGDEELRVAISVDRVESRLHSQSQSQ